MAVIIVSSVRVQSKGSMASFEIQSRNHYEFFEIPPKATYEERNALLSIKLP